MPEKNVQQAMRKMAHILHFFHSDLVDFNLIYLDNQKLDHLIYNEDEDVYQFDSPEFPTIEPEDMDEIIPSFQRFLDDNYYSYFTEGQVADIINHLDSAVDADNINLLYDYLDKHPNQVYRLSGYVNGYATDVASAQSIIHQEELYIEAVGHYQGFRYDHPKFLEHKDSDLFDISLAD